MATEANAVIDLTNIADVARMLGIEDERHNILLQDIVTGVSQRMQDWMRRLIPKATYTDEVHSGDGHTNVLRVKNYPIDDGSTPTVTIDGTAVDASDLTFDKPPGLIYKEGRWAKNDALIKITYDGGFTTVPPSLAYAAQMQSAREAKYTPIAGDHLGEVSSTIDGGGTLSWQVEPWMPAVLVAMKSYKKVP